MSTLIVGFGNKARHGKDTVAGLVHCALPAETKVYSFGAALKAVARVFGMKGKDGTVLQALGTEVFRRINPNVWVDVLNEQIDEEKPRVALIPDVRFPNEADFVRRSGGILIRVRRLNDSGTLWVARDRDPQHSSEIALDDYPFDLDFSITSGDWDGLRSSARIVTERIKQLIETQEAA